MSLSKKQSQEIHARRRAYERYGVFILPGAMDALVKTIQKGRAQFVKRQSNRISIFDVDNKRVVYDRKRKTIVTFLLKEYRV